MSFDPTEYQELWELMQYPSMAIPKTKVEDLLQRVEKQVSEWHEKADTIGEVSVTPIKVNKVVSKEFDDLPENFQVTINRTDD